MKHLNPRQGITTRTTLRGNDVTDGVNECETPKSPPGDYNAQFAWDQIKVFTESVKHLNPRQGITTLPVSLFDVIDDSVKHLNPRQGITTLDYTPLFYWFPLRSV